MFGVGILNSYAITTCDLRTPDFVSHVAARTYGFLVVTTHRKPKSSKRLRRGGVFSLSPCRARSSRFPPQTWASRLARSITNHSSRPNAARDEGKGDWSPVMYRRARRLTMFLWNCSASFGGRN